MEYYRDCKYTKYFSIHGVNGKKSYPQDTLSDTSTYPLRTHSDQKPLNNR